VRTEYSTVNTQSFGEASISALLPNSLTRAGSPVRESSPWIYFPGNMAFNCLFWDAILFKVYAAFQLRVTIRRAAITPGIQPQQVSMNTSNTEPQPLSITASGGKIIQRITLQSDMGSNLHIRCMKPKLVSCKWLSDLFFVL
jgi:hypothetical protein